MPEIHELGLDEALAAIARAQEAGDAAALRLAKKKSKDKRVAKAAGKALHALSERGETTKEAGATWTLGAEQIQELPPVAFLCLPGIGGEFPFVMVASSGAETCISWGVAGGSEGWSDVEHGHLGRSSRREVLRDHRADEAWVEVPFYAALQLVERAFDAAGVGKRPHGWEHLTSHIEEAALLSAQLLDPMRGQADAAAVDARALSYEGSPRLAPDPHSYAEYYDELDAALNSELELSEASRRERVDDIVSRLADAIVVGPSAEGLKLALDVTAFVAQQSGDEALRAAAWSTVSDIRAGRAGRDIPYARWVAEWMLLSHPDTAGALQGE